MNSQIVTVNLVPGLSAPVVVRVSQYDVGRPLTFKVLDGTGTASISASATATVTGTKPSGLGFTESGTIAGNTVTLNTTLAMTQECGKIPAEIRFTQTGEDIGTANFILAVEPSPHTEGTTDGTQETMANLETRLQGQIDALDTRVDALEAGGGSGLTQAEKNLILTLFSKAAYAEDDASTAYDALESLWASTTRTITYNLSHVTSSNTATSAEGGSNYTTTLTAASNYTLNTVTVLMGGVDITSTAYSSGTVSIPSVTGNIVITATAVLAAQSITATYTQSGTVYDTATLDSLKNDLVVTANYAGGTSETVPASDYTLSGTLTAGTSTITVSYAGLTTTFNVTVSAKYITDGLIMWLDGEYNSTDGAHETSLATWVDQTGNGWDWTNRGGVIVSSKSLVFDGSDTANFNGSSLPQNVKMMELVYKVNNSGGGVILAGFGRSYIGNISIASSTGKLSFHTATGNAESSNTAFDLGYDNTIHSVNSAGYVDGETYETTTSASDWQYAYPSIGYYRGASGSQVSYKFNGEIYCIRLYSRILTAEEIAHNFAIDADRFGIGA